MRLLTHGFGTGERPAANGKRTVRGVQLRHRALILGAVLALATNVATRYCSVTIVETHALKIAQWHSLDAQRQHLLNDGLHWLAPAATFVLFEPAKALAAVPLSVSPALRLHSDECRFSRPPPSC